MSEYQYYEFRAVDRLLTRPEMDDLRGLSTRAHISPASFINTYNWGDFRGDPDALVDKYFDAFVYVANWGTHELMLRLPKKALGLRDCTRFRGGDSLVVRAAGGQVILKFCATELDSGWEEEEGWMDALLPLRAEILAGDLRPLYLGWLLAVQLEEVDDDCEEPPVPPGLRELSASQESLVEFLDIDTHLCEVAAEASAELNSRSLSEDQLAQWTSGLSGTEKDGLLLRVANGEASLVQAEIVRRCRADLLASEETLAEPRTAGELRVTATSRAEQVERHANEQARQQREREERRLAEQRAKHLEALAKREEAAWGEADELVSTKKPNDYDRAVELLLDLQEIALRAGGEDAFQIRLRGIIERHARKYSFLERLRAAKLEA